MGKDIIATQKVACVKYVRKRYNDSSDPTVLLESWEILLLCVAKLY